MGILVHRRLVFLLLLLAPVAARGAEFPWLAFECEHAERLRGPARLCRDTQASLSQCIQLMGERAQALMSVRVARRGPYSVWVRARSAGDEPAALTLTRNGGTPASEALDGQDWHWVTLGRFLFDRGPQPLRFSGTGTLRIDQIVLAGDPAYSPTAVADTSASVKTARADIYFADDFMRSKREPGAWQSVTGPWTIRELKVREQFDPTRSANAFSYLGTGFFLRPAVAVTGYPVWRNYSLEGSVRSLGGGAFGLILLRQDDQNCYLFRYNPALRQVELLRYLEGIPDLLASQPGILQTNQWYRFRMEACDGELAASIDGHEVCRAVDHTFLQGLAGVWSADERGVFFDDVLIRSLQTFADRFSEPALPGWESAGNWTVADGLAGQGRVLTRESYADFDAEFVVRPSGRTDEEVRAEARTTNEAGLVFDAQTDGSHALLALAADPPRAELREVRNGQATVLASAPLPPVNGVHNVHLGYHGGIAEAALDGAPVLRSFRPRTGTGRVGLFATGQDARFESFRLVQAQSPPPALIHNRVFAGEDTMAAWASAECDWQTATANGRTLVWHKIEHWGDSFARYEIPQGATLPGKLGLVVRADGQKPESGYQLVTEPQPKAPAKLTLLLGNQPVASGVAPSPTLSSVELRWAGDSAVARVNDKVLFWHRNPAPPKGRRAGIWAAGWTPAFAQSSAEPSNLVDDYFETAPVEWRTETGEWEMQNRWTCSPQWSWYGGSSPDTATLWSKHVFEGDVTVHYFGAFQMKARGSRIYRPADLNISLCTDARNPSSGYSFIYGGWNNLATSLLRRERVVATTEKIALRPPSLLDTTPHYTELHRKWWHIAIEKHGPKITCYVDDQLAFEFTDPQPLDVRHTCIWTQDNSVMIARAWIAYEKDLGTEAPLTAPPEAPAPPLAPPAVAASHKAIFHSFDAGLGTWAGTPGSSAVSLEPRGDGLALAVTNPRSGGRFELKFPFEPFDAMDYPRLTFDYRLPAAARLNLTVKMNGRDHAVVLTNPEGRVAGAPFLGAADVQPDDAWHTLDVDLRALLLRCYPTAKKLPVEEIALAAWDNRNYLDAGFGGNYAGVTYRLDNVRLWAPGPPVAKFAWDPKLAVSHVLDRNPATVPGDEVASATVGLPDRAPSRATVGLSDRAPSRATVGLPDRAGKDTAGQASRGTEASRGTVEHKGLTDGTWFFHIKARTDDGRWSRAAHIPVVVDSAAPRIAATQPAAGARTPAHLATIDFADESGIDPASLVVTFMGQDLPAQVIPSDPAVSYKPTPATFDPVTKRLTVDIAAFPMAMEEGETVKLGIKAAKDFLGHAMPPAELAWHYGRSEDKTPPHHLTLDSSHPYLCDDDFETGLGEWSATPASTIIERDDSTAAEGRYSLRVHNALASGPFAVTIRSTPFDAGHHPLVSIDYKVPSNVRADLALTLGGTQYTVRFTDPYGTNCIGAIPDVRTDDQWHHTEFNLHEMLAAAVPRAASYTVTSLQLADTGFPGNADGVELHIDNFRIAPAVSTRNAPLEYKLAATAPSGIQGYQYSLTSIPAAFRWIDDPKPAWQFRNIGSGIFHFLVRARDGAGNWSQPLHREVLVDDEPPAITSVEPKAGTASADGIVRIALADAPAGIDRDKTVLTVAGLAYKTSDDGVTYDARTHVLTWSAALLAKPVTFANGQEVPVQLDTQDNVGNAASRKWSWKMDYSLDKAPPPAPYVARVPSNSLVRMTFEDDIGGWAPYGSYAQLDRVTATAATGRYALHVAATSSERYFGAYAYRHAFDAAQYPILSFDYKLPPGLAVDLHLHTNVSWQTIKLTSPTPYYPVVGTIPVTADDAWHHAEIDLRTALKAPAGAKSPVISVRYVLFADFGSRSNRPGSGFYVDNFAISAPETGQNLRFEWSSVADPTAIPGYAHILDKNPATQPTDMKGPANVIVLPPTAPGAWFFHVRARDGAGNWGAVTHFPVTIAAPPK